jgi:putative addiction module killer protein
MVEIRHYLAASGKNVFKEWLDSLRDVKAEARIAARIARLAAGNFGDCRPLKDGVWELRIDRGPGYRVYYAMVGRMCLLLLCGGDKRKQSRDIHRAVEYWNDYKRRTEKL